MSVQLRTQGEGVLLGSSREDYSLTAEERWPFYDKDEISAVTSVLLSGKVNQWTGSEVFDFEAAFLNVFGGGRAIALANGSVALELALRALDIGPGDDVIVSPRSFVASVSCVRLVGANPVFADVDPDSGNITRATVEGALTDNTRAIIPVHLAGWPADVQGIRDLARSRSIKIIEDCAQAHGAEINGQSVGTFGDAAAWSFCQDKIISTAGEGGLLTIKEEDAATWAWSFKDHGKNRSKMSEPGEPGLFRLVHDMVGTNWRMPGLQAAVGLAQLSKVFAWRELRTRNAGIWAHALAKVPGMRLPLPDGSAARHAFYKLYAYLDEGSEDEAEKARNEILKRAAAVGLRAFSGSCSEIYLEQAFADLPRPNCPVAHSLGKRSLMLEVHPTLDPKHLEARASGLAQIVHDVLA